MRAWSLGQEDALEKGKATHSSFLAWENPMDRGAWQAMVHSVAKSHTQSDWSDLEARMHALWEETLESPLDCKEIKPVNPKGNQPWIFIERTGAEAEAAILWPPDAKSWLIGNHPDAGKYWRQEKKPAVEDELVGWYHQLNRCVFEQILGDNERQRNLVDCNPLIHKAFDTT